jgi:hypothetical protein
VPDVGSARASGSKDLLVHSHLPGRFLLAGEEEREMLPLCLDEGVGTTVVNPTAATPRGMWLCTCPRE